MSGRSRCSGTVSPPCVCERAGSVRRIGRIASGSWESDTCTASRLEVQKGGVLSVWVIDFTMVN